MLIQDTIFYRPDWRWHNFLKYLTNNLSKYQETKRGKRKNQK